ncbi:MAG: 2,3-bisphosphoglycerate-independent phosphoglycerate mutase [Mycoplasma sp.]|nr:2,3-bisphosphoglycerate-independent phosphoglycerate mutase [Candidatus Hennigella equi]
MNKKVGLIIVDGVGLAPKSNANAVSLAKTPTLDFIHMTFPRCQLQASGVAVGLPHGQPGNSEIGHLTIGAGRTITSELVRINSDIDNNQFIYNPNFQKAIALAQKKHVKMHIIGLCSYGGVHSYLTHMQRILTECGNRNVKTVAHIIADGRDCDPGSIAYDIKDIQNIDVQFGEIVKIGTIGGRYYGMDRDKNWDRTKKAIDAMMQVGPSYDDLENYLADQYASGTMSEEFLIPAYNKQAPDVKLGKGDIVFIFNFRQDRVRQLAHLIKKSKLYDEPSPAWDLDLTLVTMVKYDGIDSDIVIYPPNYPNNTLGQVISKAGLSQLRIAETEKYAHVTFFFDGGKELDLPKEKKILIPSPKVATYDLQPEMSANEITAQLLDNMDKFDVVICNYANCDMVGHTGKMDATVKAVETVDACLKQVIDKAREIDMTLFITSDHGNCDKMIGKDGKPFTAHTIAPVNFVCSDTNISLHDGGLANIAPTILKYLELDIPKEMDKKPLF